MAHPPPSVLGRGAGRAWSPPPGLISRPSEWEGMGRGRQGGVPGADRPRGSGRCGSWSGCRGARFRVKVSRRGGASVGGTRKAYPPQLEEGLEN